MNMSIVSSHRQKNSWLIEFRTSSVNKEGKNFAVKYLNENNGRSKPEYIDVEDVSDYRIVYSWDIRSWLKDNFNNINCSYRPLLSLEFKYKIPVPHFVWVCSRGSSDIRRFITDSFSTYIESEFSSLVDSKLNILKYLNSKIANCVESIIKENSFDELFEFKLDYQFSRIIASINPSLLIGAASVVLGTHNKEEDDEDEDDDEDDFDDDEEDEEETIDNVEYDEEEDIEEEGIEEHEEDTIDNVKHNDEEKISKLEFKRFVGMYGVNKLKELYKKIFDRDDYIGELDLRDPVVYVDDSEVPENRLKESSTDLLNIMKKFIIYIDRINIETYDEIIGWIENDTPSLQCFFKHWVKMKADLSRAEKRYLSEIDFVSDFGIRN